MQLLRCRLPRSPLALSAGDLPKGPQPVPQPGVNVSALLMPGYHIAAPVGECCCVHPGCESQALRESRITSCLIIITLRKASAA